MNFYAIGSLICRWKGHRWSHAKEEHNAAYSLGRFKHCLRCGLERVVKTRKTQA